MLLCCGSDNYSCITITWISIFQVTLTAFVYSVWIKHEKMAHQRRSDVKCTTTKCAFILVYIISFGLRFFTFNIHYKLIIYSSIFNLFWLTELPSTLKFSWTLHSDPPQSPPLNQYPSVYNYKLSSLSSKSVMVTARHIFQNLSNPRQPLPGCWLPFLHTPQLKLCLVPR